MIKCTETSTLLKIRFYKNLNYSCSNIKTSNVFNYVKTGQDFTTKIQLPKKKLHFYECYVFVMNVCILYDPVHIKYSFH